MDARNHKTPKGANNMRNLHRHLPLIYGAAGAVLQFVGLLIAANFWQATIAANNTIDKLAGAGYSTAGYAAPSPGGNLILAGALVLIGTTLVLVGVIGQGVKIGNRAGR